MTNTEIIAKGKKSKSGAICIWESAYTDTVTKPVAYLFANEDGSVPIYIYKREAKSVSETPSVSKSWGTKLLCPIKVGMWQCKIKLISLPNRDQNIEPTFEINLNKIEQIVDENIKEENSANIILKNTYQFINNEWNEEPPEFLNKLIEASKAKVTTFNFEWAKQNKIE